jgi:hypothetical protein
MFWGQIIVGGKVGTDLGETRIIVTNLLLNDAKSEVRFKQLVRGAFTIDSSTPTLKIYLIEHPILCDNQC